MSRDRLLNICVQSLKSKGLDLDPRYKQRLKEEIQEIDGQNEHAYFVDLHRRHVKYPENQNNLLVPYLLDIVDDFDVESEPKTIQGEFPDIDVDFLKPVRDYLKSEWAAKEFGKDNTRKN